MNVSVCYNLVPLRVRSGNPADRISEAGSEKEARAVGAALLQRGCRVLLVGLGRDPCAFVRELRASCPAAVFNLCEGIWGDSRRELHAAALLDLLGVAYTGSGPLALGMTQDKARTGDLLRAHGLPTPRAVVVPRGECFPESGPLAGPMIVKPRFEDGSLGIGPESIVADEKSLARQVRYIHDTYCQCALVEEFINGRELNVALLGNAPLQVLPISEIIFKPGLQRAIVDYAGKWLQDSPAYAQTEPVCPAALQADEAYAAEDVARRACTLLGCRDYARVDIRLRDGVPFVIDVNANPDISPDAGLARSAAAAGLSYLDLVGRILDCASARTEPVHATT